MSPNDCNVWSIVVVVLLLATITSCLLANSMLGSSDQVNPQADPVKSEGLSSEEQLEKLFGNDNDLRYSDFLHDIKPEIYYFKVGGPRSNPTNTTYLHVFRMNYTDEEIRKSPVDPNLPTKLLTHGYLSSFTNGTFGKWLQKMVDKLNTTPKTTYNVFVLNWPQNYIQDRYGYLKGYLKLMPGVEAVGSYLGQFLLRMHKVLGLQLSQMHLIGYSLGSHLVGFSGKYINERMVDDSEIKSKLGRITGFDPAGLLYELLDHEERLSVDDAHYVDIVHTNPAANGILNPIGNRDIYINDGSNQPGCDSYDPNCSHLRVHQLFTDSTTPDKCQMVAYKCFDYTKFAEGACTNCQQEENRCTLVNWPVAFGEDEFDPHMQQLLAVKPDESELGTESNFGPNIYHISAGDNNLEPLCRNHYQVKLLASDPNLLLQQPSFFSRIFPSSSTNTGTIALISQDSQLFQVRMVKQSSVLWTGLLIIDNKPATQFTQALVKSANEASNSSKMLLAIEFMSNVDPLMRQAHSSLLCSSSFAASSSSPSSPVYASPSTTSSSENLTPEKAEGGGVSFRLSRCDRQVVTNQQFDQLFEEQMRSALESGFLNTGIKETISVLNKRMQGLISLMMDGSFG